MVKVFWRQSLDGAITELACSGHAGFDDGEGLDLVCAAVSALTGALGIGFSKRLTIPHRVQAGDGRFSLQLSESQRSHGQFASAQLLLQTVQLALAELAEHYPGFISIESGKKDA